MRWPGGLGNRQAATSCSPRRAIRASRAGPNASRSTRAIAARWSISRRRDPSTWSSSAPRRRWSPGVADALRAAGIAAFGRAPPPRSSKDPRASPRICAAPHGIPTAAYVAGRNRAPRRWPRSTDFALPVVVKADGLAAGKGVTVATTRAEAEAAIRRGGRRRDGHRGISRRARKPACSRWSTATARVVARLGAGSQARRRGRHRPQHRRHGRLLPRRRS